MKRGDSRHAWRNTPTRGGATLNFNFLVGGLDPSITFTRASSATYFSSTGTLTSAGNNVARFDYNPSTLAALGLLIEEQRTNSVANNTMVGAAAGSPGTVPTGWTVVASANGINRTIVGTGVENGIAYVDIQYSGTSSASGTISVLPSLTTSTAAASGQTWTGSSYVKLQAGSLANLTSIQTFVAGRDGVGALLESTITTITPTNAALNTQRYVASRTLNNASTAFVTVTAFTASYASGVAVDITLRIGLPQLENNNISTGVTSATVAAGGTGYTNGDTLTVVGGTGTAATLTVTGVSAGVVTTVSVATAGNYSVFPTSPVSVTGGTGTLATFNLTPVSQTGFATSVIQTSGAAATRSADVASVTTLTPWYNATEGTTYWEGVSNSTVAANFPYAYSFNDGTANNRISVTRNNGTTQSRASVSNGGVAQLATDFGAWAASTTVKTSFAYKASDFAASINGAAVVIGSSGTVPTVSALNIGHQITGGQLNGYLRRITYYPRRLSNTELQTVTS